MYISSIIRNNNILNYGGHKMKKYYDMILIVCMVLMLTACSNPNSEVVHEYDTSKLGGDFVKSNNEAYDIGANKDGMPIFKDVDKAFNQALIDYADGITAIQREFDLKPISSKNWEEYKTYGWQLSTDDKDILKQGGEITRFFDIYENSFK